MDEGEQQYCFGKMVVWQQLLGQCLRELPGGTWARERLVKERAEAIQTLRILCQQRGDTDFDDELALADIIEKYLFNPMEQRIQDLERE